MEEKLYMDKPKNIPKQDGSGRGTRVNRGRGGCNPPQDRGLNNKPGRGGGRNRR